ncbi:MULTISPECIES: Smr/MutS family protein [unclassified Ectothiorhodospira]|uniref:Smr/MutS family protein n=1 Tax=unclassified Ectothiorhodospira TaxID=2684909 RepID=UPI001EE9123A|nr:MULTISPECIES: Smr/MutS family protein [unclassified Ectothiorhodospira]MCG5516132.1 Smr/MutS family protein [Ectothiorhodospira sp. 9100]MCG5518599.1 Smr/MutS family protein [Ectothiorhodospira sp. 9905]
MPPNDLPEDDDMALFRAAVGQVRPVRSDRQPLQRRPPPPRPRQAEADRRRVIEALGEDPFDGTDVQPGDELIYMAEGLQRQVFRKLRRAQYRIADELDLHGLFTREAHQALALFLAEARERRLRCVRIIHGKGLRSSNRGPVLKSRVAQWLRQRSEVLAYCSAPPSLGGTGAVLVLLRLKD